MQVTTLTSQRHMRARAGLESRPRRDPAASTHRKAPPGSHAWRLPVLEPIDRGLPQSASSPALRGADLSHMLPTAGFQSPALRCELRLRERLQDSEEKGSRHMRAEAALDALQEVSRQERPRNHQGRPRSSPGLAGHDDMSQCAMTNRLLDSKIPAYGIVTDCSIANRLMASAWVLMSLSARS